MNNKNKINELSEKKWREEYLTNWMAEREDDDNDYSVEGGQLAGEMKPWCAPDGLDGGHFPTNLLADGGSGTPTPGPEPRVVTDYNLTSISLVANPLDTSTMLGNTLTTAASPETYTSNNIVFTGNNSNHLLTIDFETGNVAFGETYDFDEVSEIFWTSMGKDSPDKLKKEIAELKEQLASLGAKTTAPVDKVWERKDQIVGRGSRVTTLPGGPIDDEHNTLDIEYFRRKLTNAMSLGDISAKEVKKQLALLEDSEWVARCNRPKMTPEEAYNHAMKVLD